jgi:hypothetical protein
LPQSRKARYRASAKNLAPLAVTHAVI